MACALQANVGANTCTFSAATSLFSFKNRRANHRRSSFFFTVRASSSDDADCNDEECAPDKEVGKVSMEWLAGEKTRVVGTYPPRKQGWTGYVEKDTAGQTNIYSVEPAVYVAESAISSGNAGSSSDGAENTAAIAAGIALISVAAASSILLQVGKNSPPQVQTLEYSGPSLSYYINKFKPPEIVQAAAPAETEVSSPSEPVQSESSPEVVSEVKVEPEVLKEASNENTAS
ncbi:3'-5' DNA helicase [Stylosanthes scabra]|uniref:3'-5' DNA helicase n=1 Tax=Stylosanthes scabra TaxID=79078 RepID=A0ABU6Y902_9FABA|nr:3'-5' DNA helicase [Stylosanthes scabra]